MINGHRELIQGYKSAREEKNQTNTKTLQAISKALHLNGDSTDVDAMTKNILTKLKETGKDDELKQRHLKEYYRIIQWIVSQDLNATHIIQLLQHDKYGGLFISSRQGGKMTPARVIKKLKSRKIPYET